MGAFRAADSDNAITLRVSLGNITPSSHKRALAWYLHQSKKFNT
jgi:hypothetical protein